jgi:hypothetical protein
MNQTYWTVAGGVLLALFFYVQFTAPRSDAAVAKEPPIVNEATKRGQEAWMAGEGYRIETRKHAREGALKGFDQPWSAYCREGRHKLISGLDYYFERRGAEQQHPNKEWGESWARHVKKVWATADDGRIERLASEAYARGYFNLNDLRPGLNRVAAAEVLGKERVTGKGCS